MSAEESSPGSAPVAPAVRGRPAVSGRLGLLGGLVALVYVVAVAGDAVLAAVDGRAFVDGRRWLGSVPGRVLLAVVVVGVWFHLLDGLERLWQEHRSDDRSHGGRMAVAFLTTAVGLPLAVVVLWPLWGTVG